MKRSAPLARASRRYLTVAPSDDLVRAVVDEEVDIGMLVSLPAHQSVDIISSIAAPLVAVVAPGHRLAGSRKGVEISVLQDEPVSTRSSGPSR
jgi:DNA-binding transcriptional LysR family regulator